MILLAPAVFAAGIISAHDSAPAFTPDDKTVYFARSNTDVSLILESHRTGTSPAMASDGSFLIFASNRPARDGHVEWKDGSRRWRQSGASIAKATAGRSHPLAGRDQSFASRLCELVTDRAT